MMKDRVFKGTYAKGTETHKKLSKMSPDTFYNYCQRLKMHEGLTIQWWWSQDVYEVKKADTKTRFYKRRVTNEL